MRCFICMQAILPYDTNFILLVILQRIQQLSLIDLVFLRYCAAYNLNANYICQCVSSSCTRESTLTYDFQKRYENNRRVVLTGVNTTLARIKVIHRANELLTHQNYRAPPEPSIYFNSIHLFRMGLTLRQ